MMWLINFIQKRPTDKTILIWRILFWTIYIWVMYYNLIYLNKQIDTDYLFGYLILNINYILIAKYIMIWVWIIPVILWITNLCIHKKKYVKIVQIIFWIIIFYIAWSIKESPNLDFDVLIWLMWILPLTAWITWKCITTKCLKYKEKITKIRV